MAVSPQKTGVEVVLLPGMDGTGKLFSEFAAALSAEFKVKIIRYPTDRFLSYSETGNFIRAECPVASRFVLVAESYSTPIAIKYAALKPNNLAALVLSAGFASSPVRGWLRFFGWRIAPFMFRISVPRLAAKFWLVGPNAPFSLLESLRCSISSVKSRVLAARLRAVLECDVREEMAQVAVPVLYLRAKQDRLVTASCVEELRRIAPQVEVAAIEGPHLLLQREPYKAAEIVAGFIRSQLSPTGDTEADKKGQPDGVSGKPEKL
jgi:pimeloyl-ACP methyl ester carboxylesterase